MMMGTVTIKSIKLELKLLLTSYLVIVTNMKQVEIGGVNLTSSAIQTEP